MADDYVQRAMNAVIEDFKISSGLPPAITQISDSVKAKYNRLREFLDGRFFAAEVAGIFYTGTIFESEEMKIHPTHPEVILQCPRVPHLDTILRTTERDLAIALELAKPHLVRILTVMEGRN